MSVTPIRRAATPEHLAYLKHMNTAALRGCACRDGGWCPTGRALCLAADAVGQRLALALAGELRAMRSRLSAVR